MKTILPRVLVLVLAVGLTGCVTDSSLRMQGQQLQQQVDGLKKQIEAKDNAIEEMTQRTQKLTMDLGFFTQKTIVLEREKAARMKEVDVMRVGVRNFTSNVLKSIQKSNPEIMDYVGGELCERESADAQAGVLLVDRKNKLAMDARIIGGRVFSKGPTKVVFCLLRPDAASPAQAKVVAVSSECTGAEEGAQNWTFMEPLIGQVGDMIGLFSADALNLPYDSKGTGDVVSAAKSKVQVGDVVTVDTAVSRDTRSYSFGVTGYLGSGD